MTTELPRLYRRNINGSIQVWVIEIDGEYYRTHEGILEKKDGNAGAITHSKWTKAKPKNMGRANATTAEQQAMREAMAKHAKKVRQRFVRDLNKIDEAPSFFPPMLCSKYKKGMKPKGSYWLTQPKLDGIRCIIRASDMQSREGTPIVACPHILNQLRPFFIKYLMLYLMGSCTIMNCAKNLKKSLVLYVSQN